MALTMMLVSMTMAGLVADLRAADALAPDNSPRLKAVVINYLRNVLFCERVTGHMTSRRCVAEGLNEARKTITGISSAIGMRLSKRQQHAADKQFRVGLAGRYGVVQRPPVARDAHGVVGHGLSEAAVIGLYVAGGACLHNTDCRYKLYYRQIISVACWGVTGGVRSVLRFALRLIRLHRYPSFTRGSRRGQKARPDPSRFAIADLYQNRLMPDSLLEKAA